MESRNNNEYNGTADEINIYDSQPEVAEEDDSSVDEDRKSSVFTGEVDNN